MCTRSSTSDLFPPFEDPERLIRRRNRGDDANKHIDKFLTVTQSMKQNGVPHDVLRLCLFPYSLTHHVTAWFDRLLKNSIHSWEEMVTKFLSKYFPPSMVTKLRNNISNFRQLPDESLFEAWERYKLSIDQCPNHNMLPITQIDTFYNGLTLRHQDTINAVAGGTFMKRRCWSTSGQQPPDHRSTVVNDGSQRRSTTVNAAGPPVNGNGQRRSTVAAHQSTIAVPPLDHYQSTGQRWLTASQGGSTDGSGQVGSSAGDVNSNSNGLSSTRVDITTKIRRPHPRSNIENNRVPSVSKSGCIKNKEVKNDKSKVVGAMCKQCLITSNHNVCVLNYVNDMNPRNANQSENVSNVANQKKHKPKVRKSHASINVIQYNKRMSNGTGYSLKDKNKAKTDKTEHGFGKSAKN
ncbi:reverse transcriptase domain-containing protein [Tanacetum coccineum]